MSAPQEEAKEYLRLALVPSCAVDDSDMTPELLTYLVCLCSYASKRNDGRCWVSQTRIAARMGVTRQAVSLAAHQLQALGYLQCKEEWSQENGRQLTNTYFIDMNMTIPPERDRSTQPRKRAGIGGMPYHKSRAKSDSAHMAPATPAVAPPATPAVAPPATPAVAPPATPAVAQNTEYEYGKGIRKGKRVHAHADTSPPTFNRWLQMPESRIARAWKDGHPPRTSEQIVAYRDWCDREGVRAQL